MATVCGADPRPGLDFFPMVVEYQEKSYAAGKIPGGFFKREGRLSESEILTCRLIDRPIRPFFPDGYKNEVQIICTVLSADKENNPNILALVAASSALHNSELPFMGPIAGVVVGRVDGKLVANPSSDVLENSDINLTIAGTKDAIVMVEGGAQMVPEEEILEALYFAHDEIKKLVALQEDLRSQVGKDKVEFIPPAVDEALVARVSEVCSGKIEACLELTEKMPRYAEMKKVKGEIKETLLEEFPERGDFPYVVRIVSEILESNGSSSMASVCGGTLAMMDAGVPMKAPVAGVAMGLIKEGEKVAVLTDILGDEDHFGDMDFKVCGTTDGITALQMDIKCDGLSRETMSQALLQAKEARLHILGEMAKTLKTNRAEPKEYAPRITTIKISPDKIRDIIGPGGKTIQSITASTGVKIDINDDGTVLVASSDSDSRDRALAIIKGLTEEAEIGKIYRGVVKRITDFGAFVEILPGTDGLVHISQLAEERVENVTDIVKEGDEVVVRVL
ncbi:UNVERIFIED_CONTAM: hypothetical protein GTU68_064610, partial [Idotea baltica]|nr:hypothetical protein [Idotea baltica]